MILFLHCCVTNAVSQGLTKDGQILQDLEARVRHPKSLAVFQSLMRGGVFFSLSVFKHKSFPFQWCINFCRLPYPPGAGGSELEVCARCLEQSMGWDEHQQKLLRSFPRQGFNIFLGVQRRMQPQPCGFL